jgi:hypothetical protein
MLDVDLLGEAEAARDRLFELQHEADQAQVGYHHAIRRLHARGASLREIAEALALSYQRVHQIVDAGSGKGALKAGKAPGPCSFCGRPHTDVESLIAGPRVFICDACVARAHEAVGGDGRCSFCGRRRETAAGGRGGRARVCRDCLALCDEILAERV